MLVGLILPADETVFDALVVEVVGRLLVGLFEIELANAFEVDKVFTVDVGCLELVRLVACGTVIGLENVVVVVGLVVEFGGKTPAELLDVDLDDEAADFDTEVADVAAGFDADTIGFDAELTGLDVEEIDFNVELIDLVAELTDLDVVSAPAFPLNGSFNKAILLQSPLWSV